MSRLLQPSMRHIVLPCIMTRCGPVYPARASCYIRFTGLIATPSTVMR